MKTTTLALVLTLAALPLSVRAESPQPAGITIDCAHPKLPSQQAVARLTGIDNFGHAYAARTRLLINAQRRCKQLHADTILLVRESGMEPAERRVAVQRPR